MFHGWYPMMLLYSLQEKAAIKQVFIISEAILQEEEKCILMHHSPSPQVKAIVILAA